MSEEIELQNIHGTDWDYLIVLDACRYDVFKEEYSELLEGDLRKVESKGSATPEWLWKTFTSRYNYNYISANPYINNSGNDMKNFVAECTESWKSTETFTNIVDAWAEDWDAELGTVHPEDLTNTVLEEEPKGKTIIHYIQPHRPYISSEVNMHTWWAKEEIEDAEKSMRRKFFDKTRQIWKPLFTQIPSSLQSKIKDTLGAGNDFEGLVEKVGEEQVKEYYRKDLRLTLEQVSRLTENLEGRIIVTADHGELLGEKGDWGHPIDSKREKLRNVPWLEVEN